MALLFCAVGLLHLLSLSGIQQNRTLFNLSYDLADDSSAASTSCVNPQKIFLDVGANRGDVLRIFYNLGEQPENSNNRQWKFGVPNYQPNEWRVIALEASPRMADALHQLQQQYHNLEVHVPVAAWTADDQRIPLGIDDTTEEQKGWLAGSKHGEWGSSVFQNATDTVVTVPTIDLSRFVRETVHCPQQDTVYLKMNVEGAEFPVIRHMMAEGTLCWMSYVDIYWHSHLMPEQERTMWKNTFIPLVRQYIQHVCSNTQIHVWGVH